MKHTINSQFTRKTKRFFFLTILLIVAQMGCKKFVTVPPPTAKLVIASTFDNSATATSAVIYIYSDMMNNKESLFLSLYNGLLADELTCFSGNTSLNPYYFNALTSTLN